ncbi:hypothetical protein ACM55F_07670 [Flavobacterium sp. XS2P12]|uniref:hypothetical protein n=1 Tax=Flavobacterium melibiosi TaxID=3398734 RepID=UPI003A897FA6
MKIKMKLLYCLALLLFFAYSAKAQTIPESAREKYVMAITLRDQVKNVSDYDLPIAKFKDAIQLAPSWADAYKELGLTLELAGQFDDAIYYLSKYLSFNPSADDARKAQDEIYIIKAKKEKANSPQALAEDMVSNLHKKYSGHISQTLICGVYLNRYWICTENQANKESNWVDSRMSGQKYNYEEVISVQFKIGGKEKSEIRLIIETRLEKGEYSGKLNGMDPNNIVWSVGDTSYKISFANTKYGKPMISISFSCGENGCRRERIIFDEP